MVIDASILIITPIVLTCMLVVIYLLGRKHGKAGAIEKRNEFERDNAQSIESEDDKKLREEANEIGRQL